MFWPALRASLHRRASMSADTPDLAHRIADIEEAYEFMLGYAAQGHQRGREGDHIRDFLKRLDAALDGIGAAAISAVQAKGVDTAILRPFLMTLEEDAGKARAGLQLALMQRAIGSQLVDNLNASMHLRALLTDLFLIDEAISSMGV
jgi:hypothetical protein